MEENKISEDKHYTIAFYNIENLFDIHNNPLKNDDDFIPGSRKRWTLKRYKNKLRKLSFAISSIGFKDTLSHPAIVGLAEVENAKVLQELIDSKHLKDLPYAFVHYESPDERGIDVALLYDKNLFKVIHSKTFSIELTDENNEVDYTRDILLVTGEFKGEKIHLIVNHWPSRRQGSNETEYKRLKASDKVVEIINQLKQDEEDSKIIVMGDFNDDPASNSIKQLVKAHGLFNPMDTLLSYTRGTTTHHSKWNLFDQIMVSPNFFERESNSLRYVEADIFDEDFLKLFNGKYKGSPFRTYVGKKYKGGYSDHFPVHITVKMND